MFRFELNVPSAELRLLEERHAEELFALSARNRAQLRRWLPWIQTARSAEDTRRFIRGALGQLAEGKGFQAGVWYRGRLAGVIGYHPIDWATKSAAVGYWLGEEFQGRGLMTEACRALLRHAFGELHLNRVEIRCAVDNHRSRAIPERLGFLQEGVLREALLTGKGLADEVVYGLLAGEWRRTQGKGARRSSGTRQPGAETTQGPG